MIADVIMFCVELIKAVKAAGGDAEAQDQALMAAEERIARLRAKAKFG